MYRRILVPLDGSRLAEQVLPYVRIMADALQASIHLLRVHEEEVPARAYLEQVGSGLRAWGHAVHAMVGTGDAAAQIFEEGFRQPATLIAMATHGRSGLTRWAVGSVTDKVLRATASPLLIIKPRTDDRSPPARLAFRSMIVPLDGSREAEAILELVVALRASLKPDTLLVRVIPESGRRGSLEQPSEEGTSEANAYLEQVRGRLSRPGGPAVTIHVLRGRPADAIAGLAHETPEVLIAMTTHGRTGVSRWVLGSVADRVVRTAGVPVLVVQPGGGGLLARGAETTHHGEAEKEFQPHGARQWDGSSRPTGAFVSRLRSGCCLEQRLAQPVRRRYSGTALADTSDGGLAMHRPGTVVGPSGDAGEAGCAGLTIRHVLVPLDGSPLAECALPWAVAVAQALAARVTLLRVLEAPALSIATSHHHDAVDWQMRRAEAQGQLARVDRELKGRELTSAVEVLEGRPAEQIINFARAQQADLIVLSSHGEGGLTGWTLSSTVLMVVARTHSSVLVVPAHAAEGRRIGDVRVRRLLVPLDCSPRAECVLPLATALARAHGAEMILAHVVPEPEMPRRLPPSAEDLAMVSRLTERNRHEAERYLGELRARLVDQKVRVGTRIAVASRRARTIRTMADEADADLVLVSAHGQTGDPRERYGSVAGRLLEEGGRPILVLQDLGAGRGPTPAEEAARSRPGH